ncbi:MAG: bifunctional hydroxymethylpyrimidine kinase/phosphomethylpyrimidine kinase, partial [Kiritimatiellia bacterium]
LVVDPVMLATSGARLLRSDAVRVLIEELLPLATVVTPNLPEAEVLAAMTIRSPDEMAAAARRIHERCGCACVVKGGHMQGGASVLDVLWDGARLHQFRHPRLAAHETHGTGCTFSAALAASLALGLTLPRATAAAQAMVYTALRSARPAGSHWPLNLIQVH